MPVTLNVRAAGNEYALRVFNGTIERAPVAQNAPAQVVPQNAEAVRDREADGLLTRMLQRLCRDSDAAYVGRQLANDLLTSNVNLSLDHADEVDRGAGTRRMDDDWVNVDLTSTHLKGPDENEGADVCAQRTMAELEHVTADEVRAAYADVIRDLHSEQEKADAIRNALREDGGHDGVRGKIAAAIDAQYRLMNKLCDFCLSRGVADKGLEMAATRCGCCAQSLTNLVVRLALGPQEGAAAQNPSTTSVAQSLVRQMMSLDERTQRERTETVVRIFDEQLSGLQTLYRNLTEHPRLATKDDFNQIADELKKAKRLLKDARGGVRLRDSQTKTTLSFENLDKGLLRQLEERVDKMAVEVGRLRTDALGETMKALNDEIPCELVNRLFTGKNRDRFLDALYGNQPRERARVASAINTLVADFKALKGALAEVRKTGDATRARQIVKRMCERAFESGAAQVRNIIQSFCSSPRCSASSFKPRIALSELELLSNKLVFLERSTPDGVVAAIDRLADMVGSIKERHLPLVEGDLLAGVLDGTCGLATAALASAWRAKTSLLEPGIDDRNLVSSRQLGHGNLNFVTLCTYRMEDGRTVRRVFKPEIQARYGWVNGRMEAINPNLLYGPLQQVTMANVVVSKVADELGIGNCVVRSHPGVHAGQYGLMMEIAEGETGGDIDSTIREGNPENVMLGQKSLQEVKNILETDSNEARILIGNMCHAFVDLNWLDNITGQTDRHAGNYLISVGEDLSVSVRGIDNDLCLAPPTNNDIKPLPSVISRTLYTRIESMVRQIEGLTGDAAWERLAGQLGTDDLPKGQGIEMIARLRAAWAHASSNKCAIVEDDAGWRNMDMIKDRFQNDRTSLFGDNILSQNIFGLSRGCLAWAVPEFAQEKKWFARMQAVMNAPDLAGRLATLGNAADIPVDEFIAHIANLNDNPRDAVRVVDWKEGISDDDILSALVNSYRESQNKLFDALENEGLQRNDPIVKSFLRRYYRGGCGKDVLAAEQFVDELKVFKANWQFLPARIGNLLVNDDAFDWVALLAECHRRIQSDIDNDLLVEALVSELRNGTVNPEDLHIDRLLRLVVNKLSVSPESVLGPNVRLDSNQYALFLMACARTPSGENYYHDVRTAYENLAQGGEA